MNPTVLTLLILLMVAFAIARATRFVCQDVYPPMQWVRDRWDDLTGDSLWNKLLHCVYCAAPWITAMIWGPVYGLNSWPFGWGIALVFGAALSYIAAIIVVNDGE